MPRTKSGLFDQSKYVQQFMREKVTVKKVTFNKETDADLLAWMSGKKFSTYIKELIRQDMGKQVGHWVNSAGDNQCSVCGETYSDLYPDYSHTHFCPNCGSKMT